MRKGKEEVEFNLADYDYMDSMRLEGWVWEFIRRNEKYFDKYYELQVAIEEDKKTGKNDSYGEWSKDYFDIGLHNWKNPYEKWNDGEPFSGGELSPLNPLRAYNMKYGLKIEHYQLNLYDGEDSTFLPGTTIPYADINVQLNEKDETIITYKPDYENCTYHPLSDFRETFGNKNVMMAMIDISTPENIDDLLKYIKKYLLKWKKALNLPKTKGAKTPKKNKNLLIKNSKIWKSYLIVYDLVQSGASYGDVSDVLSQYDEFYISEKVIERHYKSAAKMINSGYKKYL